MSRELPFIVNTSAEIMSWRASTFWEKEPETIQWILDYATKSDPISFFFDCGANIGMYSLYCAAISPTVQIIACEPAPNNISFLLENVELNGFHSRFKIITDPLSFEVFEGSLVNRDSRPGSSGAQVHRAFSLRGLKIKTQTGDHVVEAHGVNNAILKIDVDGNELDVLLGFSQSLKKKLFKSVLVELTSTNILSIEKFMFEHGYSEDLKYRKIKGHSDLRREATGKQELNRVFTHNPSSMH